MTLYSMDVRTRALRDSDAGNPDEGRGGSRAPTPRRP